MSVYSVLHKGQLTRVSQVSIAQTQTCGSSIFHSLAKMPKITQIERWQRYSSFLLSQRASISAGGIISQTFNIITALSENLNNISKVLSFGLYSGDKV